MPTLAYAAVVTRATMIPQPVCLNRLQRSHLLFSGMQVLFLVGSAVVLAALFYVGHSPEMMNTLASGSASVLHQYHFDARLKL
ncbi:MAG: hypothetical protein ACKO34_00920 [Vampirovibrionales bacterium]